MACETDRRIDNVGVDFADCYHVCREEHVGCVRVIDARRKLGYGFVTERDLTVW